HAEADVGERRRLQRVEAHLAQHRRLVTLRAAGIDGDVEAAAGGLLPLLAHLLEVLVPDRILRNERRELDARLRDRRGHERAGHQCRDRYCLARFAVHSICPMPAISALPLTMESPSMSPLISTVRSPFGVLAINVSLSALPSIVPVTGASPI